MTLHIIMDAQRSGDIIIIHGILHLTSFTIRTIILIVGVTTIRTTTHIVGAIATLTIPTGIVGITTIHTITPMGIEIITEEIIASQSFTTV